MKRDCPLDPGAVVWASFRDSGGTEQERSVGRQLDVAREYAAQHGLQLTLTFSDEARVGSTLAGRDALADLLARARQLAPDRDHRHPDAPDVFLFWDTRRLGRDQLDNAFIKADLRRRGYTIIFLADDIPDVGDFTPVIEAFLDWKAEQDLKDIARDVQRGLQDLARKGYHPGGFPPRGYKAERIQVDTRRDGSPRYASRWVHDPATAHLARQAWSMRAAGASYLEIQQATGLYKTKGHWKTFFANRTYLGVTQSGQLEIPDTHEPLCTEKQWAAVRALDGTAQMPWRCYLCGRLRNEGWDAARRYGCQGGKLSAHAIEAAVLTPEYLQGMLDRLGAGARHCLMHEAMARDLAEAQAGKRELNRAIDGSRDSLELGPRPQAPLGLGAPALVARLTDRERERAEVLARLARLEMEERAYRDLELSPAQLESLAEELRRGWVPILGLATWQRRARGCAASCTTCRQEQRAGRCISASRSRAIRGAHVRVFW